MGTSNILKYRDGCYEILKYYAGLVEEICDGKFHVKFQDGYENDFIEGNNE